MKPTLVTEDAVAAFAEHIGYGITREEAGKLSRLFSAQLEAQLHTRKQTANAPEKYPWMVNAWRDMSVIRRRLFGQVINGKRVTGVIELRGGQLAAVQHEYHGGHMTVLFNRNMWQAPLADSTPEYRLAVSAAKYHLDEPTVVAEMTADRLRESIPRNKKKWHNSRYRVDQTNEQWPLQLVSGKPTNGEVTLTGEQVNNLTILFTGVTGKIHVAVDKKVVCFISKYVRVVFEMDA